MTDNAATLSASNAESVEEGELVLDRIVVSTESLVTDRLNSMDPVTVSCLFFQEHLAELPIPDSYSPSSQSWSIHCATPNNVGGFYLNTQYISFLEM